MKHDPKTPPCRCPPPSRTLVGWWLGRGAPLDERCARAKSVAVVVKVRLPMSLHHLRDGLLNKPIQHRGNTQRAGLPVRLRNFHVLDRLRPVLARFQSRTDFQPVASEVVWQFIDCHAIDARRAFVLAHLLQCALQARPLQHLGQQRLGVNRLGLA